MTIVSISKYQSSLRERQELAVTSLLEEAITSNEANYTVKVASGILDVVEFLARNEGHAKAGSRSAKPRIRVLAGSRMRGPQQERTLS
jgi:hypothetical protein